MMSNQLPSQQTEKISTLESQGFDYATLDAETQLVVQQQTNEIRTLMRRTAQDIVNIGQKLIGVKQQLEHGQFRNWLKAEFDWSVRTAARFMQVATKFKSAKLAQLEIAASALYLLAEPSTPSKAQEEALELAKQGENISYAKAKEIINQHKEAAMLATSTPENVNVPVETVGWRPSTPAPAMALSVAQSPEIQSAAITESSEDKPPGEIAEIPNHFQISNLVHNIAPHTNSEDSSSEEQTDINIQILSLVENLIYLTDLGQHESRLLGQITEVREVTTTDVIIYLKVVR